MIYKVKRDVLYRVIFYMTFLLLLYGIYSHIINREWIVLPISILLICFLGWIWFGSSYTIQDDVLTIRLGPFKRTIRIKDIYEIRKVNSPLASAALAIERLEINYHHYKTIQISPKDKEHFSAHLQSIQSTILIVD